MSPATLRRWRAERLLARDFEALRESVLAGVAARLGSTGGSIDRAELEAFYATAWQGLYGAVLAGQLIESPRAWLVTVTYRRAVEVLRSPAVRRMEPLSDIETPARDLDAELEDRATVRALLLGIRAELDLREREAAALCYLQGYSRREAAERMGVSEQRMRKLMEGNGRRAGVSAKVGEVVRTIRSGAVCDQHASLMRALAFGVLDPEGERYRLALAHRRDCPACRRYVAVLRGAAAILPPVLTVPGGRGALGIPGLAGSGHHFAGTGSASASGSASGAGLGASAATGGGAGAGGWALGPLGAKLATGCLLAAGMGAGCVAVVQGGSGGSGARRHHRVPGRASVASLGPSSGATAPKDIAATAHPRAAVAGRARASAVAPDAAAAREFGPEGARAVAAGPARAPVALAAASGRTTMRRTSARNDFLPDSARTASSGDGAAAREFSPG